MTADLVPLKYVATLNDDKLDESTDPDYEFDYVDIGAVGRGRLIEAPERMCFREAPSRARRLVQPGDTIISTVRTYLRAVWAVQCQTEHLVVSTGFAVVRPRSINARFLRWAVQSDSFIEAVVAASTGVSYPAINPGDLASLRVWAPPQEQQRRIADFLDAETARIDALISAKQRMLDVSVERYEVALSNWWQEAAMRFGTTSIRRLGAVVEQGWSPPCLAEPAPHGRWGVLKTSAVTGNHFDPLANKCLPEGTEPDLRWKVEPGDLLMVRGSGSRKAVGAVAVADPGDRLLTISDLIYRIRGLDGPPGFHAAALRSLQVRQVIESTFRTDAGQTLKLRSDDIRDLPHPAVPVDRMASVLDELLDQTAPNEELRSMLIQQVELLREHRQALITAAVAGELTI